MLWCLQGKRRQDDDCFVPTEIVNADCGGKSTDTAAAGSRGSSAGSCGNQSEVTAFPADVVLQRVAALSVRQHCVEFAKKSCLPATSKWKRSKEAAAHRCIDKMSRRQSSSSRRIPPECCSEQPQNVTGQASLQLHTVSLAATISGNTGSSALLSAAELSSVANVEPCAARHE